MPRKPESVSNPPSPDPELSSGVFDEPPPESVSNPPPPDPAPDAPSPAVIEQAGQAPSPEEDAQRKQEANPLQARPVDSLLPPLGDRQQVLNRTDPENARNLTDYPGTRSGEQGPPSDEEGNSDKDTSPMPSGGPKDPAVTAGRERRRQITYEDAFPTVGPDTSAPRERRLIPTGVMVEVGPRVLPQVENAPVVVLERSFINNVERVRGDLVTNYTGGLGKNLRAATPEEIAAGQGSV